MRQVGDDPVSPTEQRQRIEVTCEREGYEAEERGVQILVGIGLLVVGLFIIHALGAWLADRNPQPELAPTA